MRYLRNPYRIERTYVSTLSVEQIRTAIRDKIDEQSFLSLVKPYRGYYRKEQFLLYCQPTGKGLMSVKIKGIVAGCLSGVQIKVSYQTTCSPLYVLIPAFCLILYCNVIATNRTINGGDVSFWEMLGFTMGILAVVSTMISLNCFHSIARQRLLLEEQLKMNLNEAGRGMSS